MSDLDNGADLRERFDYAMADLAPPDGLTAGVLTDGRRLRRRRRVLTASCGVAVAVVVTALVAANVGDGSPSTDSGFATQPTAPAPTPQANEKQDGLPSPGPADPNNPFPDLPEGWWDAPGDQLLAHLRIVLPETVEITDSRLSPDDSAPGEPDVSAGWLHADLTGPAGPGGFEIILYMPDLKETPDPVEVDGGLAMLAQGPANRRRIHCGHQARYTDNCEEILNGDGVAVGRLTTLLQDGTITFYEATLLGPDGGLVYMSAWNATDVKPGPETPASADVPPLTIEQLRQLVQDPAWTSYTP